MPITAPKHDFVPQTFWEWLASVYPPDKFVYEYRAYPVTLISTPTVAGADQLKVEQLYFCFGIRSFSWVTASGAAPTFPVRLLASKNAVYWTGNNGVAAELVTGDASGSAVRLDLKWDWPRELYREDTVNLKIDSSLNAAAASITSDVILWGFQVLARPPSSEIVRG